VVVFAARSVTYGSLVPPFEAPDENSHYEYARLLGELGRVPATGDRSERLHAEVSQYMLARGLGLIIPPGESGKLAFNMELGRQPPTYYLLPSAIGWLVGAPGLEAEVRAMRLASTLLGVLTLLVAIATAREAFVDDPFAAGAMPVLVALTPGFVFISSVLNNDNLANLGGALAFWGVARVVRRGPRAENVALALAGLGLGLAAKRTALAVLPGVAVVLYGAWVLRRGWPLGYRLAALALPLAVLVTHPLWAFVPSTTVSAWQLSGAGESSWARGGLFGERALSVAPQATGQAGWLRQSLSTAQSADVADEGVTLGAWVRTADGRAGTARMELRQGEHVVTVPIPVDGIWRFNGRSVPQVGREPLVLTVFVDRGRPPVLFDGVVVAPGRLVGPPERLDADGTGGLWAGREFVNLVRNGSGEDVERRLTPWLGRVFEAVGAAPEVVVGTSRLDRLGAGGWEQTGWLIAFAREGYVGRFSWMTLPLAAWVYAAFDILLIGALIGLAGVAVGVARRRGSGDRTRLWIIGTWAVAVCGGLLVALLPFLVGARGTEWPQGRYIYPCIVPISGLIAAGVSAYVPRAWKVPALAVWSVAALVLNLYVLVVTVIPRYQA
jgi:4-amino-4-deoxy-L-arabinose transferase-like glycosyltransferase